MQVYSSPAQKDIYDLTDRAYYVNTYLKMLNSLLSKKKLTQDNSRNRFGNLPNISS